MCAEHKIFNCKGGYFILTNNNNNPSGQTGAMGQTKTNSATSGAKAANTGSVGVGGRNKKK